MNDNGASPDQPVATAEPGPYPEGQCAVLPAGSPSTSSELNDPCFVAHPGALMNPVQYSNPNWQYYQPAPQPSHPAVGPLVPFQQPSAFGGQYFQSPAAPYPNGTMAGPPMVYPQPSFQPRMYPTHPQMGYNNYFPVSPMPQQNYTGRRPVQFAHLSQPRAASPGDPRDSYKTQTRPFQMAHRPYLRWLHTVYKPTMSPHIFVQQWCHALQDIREIFGYYCMVDIVLFNQFLSAVAFNSGAHAWIDSIHIPMDNVLPPSIMEQLFADFQVCEARRLHLPGSTWEMRTFAAHIPDSEWVLSHYCPFHKVLSAHTVEGCELNPARMISNQPWPTGGNEQK